MRELLEQVELYLVPREGEYDVEAVAGAILSMPYSFRDPHNPVQFLVSYDQESYEEFEKRVRERTVVGYPMILLISVRPREVLVNQFAGGPETLEPSRHFLTWLFAHYDVTVRNEEGTDLSGDIGRD